MWSLVEYAFTAVLEFVTDWFVRIVRSDER
jgi:hypothetical protein